jgi:hypothetical protein
VVSAVKVLNDKAFDFHQEAFWFEDPNNCKSYQVLVDKQRSLLILLQFKVRRFYFETVVFRHAIDDCFRELVIFLCVSGL